MFVKICGLSTPRAIDAAVSSGADAIGFVFADSPRQVTAQRANQLCRDVPPVIFRVAVMRHPSSAEWQSVLDGFEPDWLQTDSADFAGLDVPERVTRCPVVRDGDGLEVPGVDDLLLFEAAESGQGVRANWQRAAELAMHRRLVLAGGLTPDNVGEAIATVRPYGVDVSSGVESKRGVKDVGRIAAFITAVREAEQGYAN